MDEPRATRAMADVLRRLLRETDRSSRSIVSPFLSTLDEDELLAFARVHAQAELAACVGILIGANKFKGFETPKVERLVARLFEYVEQVVLIEGRAK